MIDDDNWQQISLSQEKWALILEAIKEVEISNMVLEDKPE